MRVKEFADLAGTTVRTVRYYHQEGLLPVPGPSSGRRDYGLDHLARLVRIRWLAQSGLSLDAVAARLAGPERGDGDELTIFTRALDDIDERIADLTRQREQLAAIVEQARRDGGVRPLGSALSRFYDRMIALLPTPEARRVLAGERKVATILALWGVLPVAPFQFLDDLTAEDDADIVAMFTAFAELGHCPPGEYPARSAVARRLLLAVIDRHEDAVVEFAARIPDGPLGRPTKTVLRRLLAVGYPAPGHRRFIDDMGQILDASPRLADVWNGKVGS